MDLDLHIARRSAPQRRRMLVAALCAGLLAGVCQAQSRLSRTQPGPQESLWLAASDRTLDKMRGGFDLGTGLFVSFGISRAVYINGQLTTSTSLQVGDLGRLTTPQAQALSRQLSNQTLIIQNGSGNTVAAGALAVPLATYIQNTLNNQTILSQTSIQATTNGLGMLKNLNLQTTIDGAIAQTVGVR